ncbi:MAG: tRNA glutamyl-Q(34) synthetase GluQRS [Comamonadaceae bacterium]|nr:MAG: tRNA glutamyl-Q(34) synthetase GluQRS [Comamonadaceae bacterium]
MRVPTGRFAPSPTGLLHAGSLAAALASWLDVRARGDEARWLVRIEDADTVRSREGWGRDILRQLQACGLVPDETPLWQTTRGPRYETVLERLRSFGLAYACACSRKDIDEALARSGAPHRRHVERVYPGTCRCGLNGRAPRAWRFATHRWQAARAQPSLHWHDRRLGPQCQDVEHEVGDFVLRRADGPWSYQLAVVVDDADQGVTDVVRGEDLTDNTARQIALQQALGLPTPTYLHVPLVLGANGEKLSKQNGATPIDIETPVAARASLGCAARALGLIDAPSEHIGEALGAWVVQWAALYNRRP